MAEPAKHAPIEDISTLGYHKQLALGVQHVFTLFASTVLVPIITGLDVGVALVMSGTGTLLFHMITQKKVPAYLGSSFSFIAPILLAGEMYGLAAARGGIVVAGLIYAILAGLISKFGPEKILRFFPPVVTGPIIIVISMTLAPNAINMASQDWLLALITLAVIIGVASYSRGFFKIIPVIVGLAVGYIVAALLGRVDYTAITQASWIGVPNFELPSFNIGAIAIVAPIALVTVVEHVGDVLAMSGVVRKNLSVDPGLGRTLLGDGIATSLSAFLGGPANTTYSQNTGVVALTKVYDPKVMRIAAVITIMIGLIPKLNAFTSTIPTPVIGGAVVVLFGMIASIGARTLVNNRVDFSKTRNMIIGAVILVFGLGGAVIPIEIGIVKVNIVGMALAAIVGIGLNIILPKEEDDAAELKL
ncbi:uracil/xanthine transporter [Alkalispirochaeta sphaeroplastigenens]|uniref:Uracil/xanthine transporter n=1 Tax=Alkalispirochaeta sphaeroplastigenens TaxID=1187066 RepID=A0A2S4JXD9_9SPIO|nr:uracil-xanthine permease family protein [Alkalispirochaeta sphaeroplastigenens]POR04153.1 uracil/xanthine transporter [Alkalispirochaeta sphaeroplastigenens]